MTITAAYKKIRDEKILKIAFKMSSDQSLCWDIDEDVHKAKASEADLLADEGPVAQLRYLAQNFGSEILDRYLEDDCPSCGGEVEHFAGCLTPEV